MSKRTPLVLLVVLTCFSGRAFAQDVDPAPGRGRVSAAVLGGVATGFLDYGERGSVEPFGQAFGLRAGYTLPSALYLGGQAFAFSTHGATHLTLDDTKPVVLRNLDMAIGVGGEVGYDLALGSLVLRPSAGIGLAQLRYTGTLAGACVERVECVPGSSLRKREAVLYLSPGASLSVPVGPLLLGIDPRLFLFSGENIEYAFTGFASAGVRL